MKKKVEKENLITALYCRLSVDDIPDADAMDSRRLKEELESNSITHQKQILEDYCKKNGIRNYRFFADVYNQRLIPFDTKMAVQTPKIMAFECENACRKPLFSFYEVM